MMPKLYHVNVIPSEPFLVVPKVSFRTARVCADRLAGAADDPKRSCLRSERRDKAIVSRCSPPLCILAGCVTSADVWRAVTAIRSALYTTLFLCRQPRRNGCNASSPMRKPSSVLALTIQRRRWRTLYDPDLMPPDLRKAHQVLDRAVDNLYRRSGFTSERERVEHLLGLYEKMALPLAAKAKPKRRRRKPT